VTGVPAATDPPRALRAGPALLWLAALAVLGVLIFAPGLDIPYYSDDFYFVLADPHLPWHERFTRRNEGADWYRPVEAIVLGMIQGRAGTDPRPLHATVLGIHVLLAWMVWLATVRLGGRPPAAEVASVWFLAWQANAMAVLSNDTLSQVLSTVLGCAATLMLWVALDGSAGRGPRRLPVLLAIVAFAAALFTKESGIGFLLVLSFLLVFRPPPARGVGGRVLVALALVAVIALYFGMRAATAGAAMPMVGEGRYQFRLGANLAVNAAKLAFAMLLPTSTVTVFDALQARRWLPLALTAVATAALLALVVAGVWRWRRGRTALALLLMGALALSPTLLLNHVSELYAYSATPFVAVIVGAAFAALLGSRSSAAGRVTLIAVLGGMLLAQVSAVRQKAALMEANGRRAEVLVARLEPYVRGLPPGATLWLVLPPRSPSAYSVFHLDGFELVRGAELHLVQRFGRPDAKVRQVREPGPSVAMRGPDDVTLRLEGDALVP